MYKSERYLSTYLESVSLFTKKLEKVGIVFEFVLISNDQNEKEKDILTPYLHYPWIKLVNVPKETLYASWNRGVREAQFPTCTFWNVDDIRFPEAVVDGLSLVANGEEFVYFPFRYKRYIKVLGLKILVKSTIINPPSFDRNIFIKGMHSGPFFMFTKTLYEKVGAFNESFKIAGDFDWCVRAAKITNFAFSKEIAGIFINEGTSLSGSKSTLQQEENNRIIK